MAAKRVYAALDMRGNKLNSVGDPTAAQDAATKSYVDNLAHGGDVTGTPAAIVVAKVRGVAVSAVAPTAGQLLTATSPTAAAWATLAASSLGTRWEPLTNGDPASPELIFDGIGDVIMVEVAA